MHTFFTGINQKIPIETHVQKQSQNQQIDKNPFSDQLNCMDIDVSLHSNDQKMLKRKRNYKSIFTKFSKF